MRHSRRQHNRISCLYFHNEVVFRGCVQGSSTEEKLGTAFEDSIAFMCDGVVVMCTVMLEDSTFLPGIGLDGRADR
jgi:hypothetical protein